MATGLVAEQELGTIGTPQITSDGIPTYWIPRDESRREAVRLLRSEIPQPYRTLYDLTAIDERGRKTPRRASLLAEFSVVYHLLSYERNDFIRLKVALNEDGPSIPSISSIYPNANWYEREAWDMFGIAFDGHPHLSRILMPRTWQGHPLRKDHPARATEMGPFQLPDDKAGCRTGSASIPSRGVGHEPGPRWIGFHFFERRPAASRALTASCASFSNWMGRRFWTPFPTSVSIIAARRRWASARPGTPTFLTPIAWIISAG